jgi:hypothetical protein
MIDIKHLLAMRARWLDARKLTDPADFARWLLAEPVRLSSFAALYVYEAWWCADEVGDVVAELPAHLQAMIAEGVMA